ncbi:MAG: class I adenylate cyclase [Desulfamplus sp.]|nr:class I adenylate cyclase [Desulfamplus sp.]
MLELHSDIEKNKKNFLLHNVVRLREMIRYLPNEKLNLFKQIPFLIHVNSPEFPGYVKLSDTKSADFINIPEDNIFGVWNFENSGFAKDIAENNPVAKELLNIKCHHPVVQAIYHIGSLGTFTQSAKSDFDFWVVIEKNDNFSSNFIDILHEKLTLITTYSRKAFSQEVTFFVHYAHNLKDNIFDNPDDEDSVAVPELLLKEEFYRTFIMVAGKIPLWAVQPLSLTSEELSKFKKEALDYGGFIDLGTFDSMPIEEVQRGLLWQICKAPYDPVKSVIKASITASYNVNKLETLNKAKPILLCDMVKERFGQSIIDDYAADPYIIAFDRILEFYTELGDQRALSQIKAAIFFRLCGFPLVSPPPKDSPKRKILDKYIRKWQLSTTRLKKLLDYQNWSESEKTLFDHTMIDRLYLLYKASLQHCTTIDKEKKGDSNSLLSKDKDKSYSELPLNKNKRENDLRILKNKVDKITLKKKGVLPKASTYLKLKPQDNLTIISKENENSSPSYYEWLLFSPVKQKGQSQNNQSPNSNIENRQSPNNNMTIKYDATKIRYNLLYSSKYFMETLGFSMYNHIYIRGTTNLKMQTPFKLYGSLEKISDCDDIYLALQPWMPLSDEPFLSEPFWEKIIVLLFTEQRAEFLIRNSWGEIFFETVSLDKFANFEEKCYHTAMKILEYHIKGSNYSIFQMGLKPIEKFSQKIKTIVEDTKILRSSSKNIDSLEKNGSENISDINIVQRRPYLDSI